MRKLYLLFLLLGYKVVFSQCTPASLLATSNLNTPGYTLNTAFNATTTSSATINNLSNNLINFSATVSGAATWGTFASGNPASGGVQMQNDATVGDYIYVQPTNAPSTTPANYATYTFNFTETLYNFSMIIAGLNNNDRIIASAYNGANPITIDASNFSNADAGVSVSGNTVIGTSTSGGTSVNTNRVTLTIAGPVTQIIFQSGKSTNSTSTVTLGFTSVGYTRCVNVPADFNATFVNTAVTGNVSTNDIVPSGTQYGTATAQSGNPGSAVPVVNSDGTYSFTSSVAGVFKFTVPMCPPGIVTPNCPDVPLIITVTQPSVYTNDPIANIDRATTQINTAVTLPTLANDKAGNNSSVALNPASVTVTVAPLHGTTSVNTTTGDITYTPGSGYTGFDTLTYQVCDLTTPTPLCATSYQIITIQPTTVTNNTVAADDFNSTSLNTAVSGDVKTNDNDPQGNTQTVTAQTTTLTGKGTLDLNTDGSYTFTPASGFSGPVNYPYQTCDDGSPVACTDATLYILVYSSFPLPLDITSFTATAVNADTKLSWTYENQIDVSHFEIERAASGSSSFVKVGEVTANNNASGTYTFTDINAKQSFTKGYYRLKIVDLDGHFTYSKIVLVTFDNDVLFLVRPTIVSKGEAINIQSAVSSAGTVYNGYLFNTTGQLAYSWKAQPGATFQIPTGNLSAGVYIIQLVSMDKTITQKVIIH